MSVTVLPRGFFPLVSDYDYDANGNLVEDSGKDLEIDYNLLNLPTYIFNTDTHDEMLFEYAFGGEKLKKVSIIDDTTRTRLYIGGFEFLDDEPEAFHHLEGRIVLTDTTPRFQFKITDHLGNTVVLFEDKDNSGTISTIIPQDPEDAEVVQRNLYYPFGMQLDGTWKHLTAPRMNYTYNAKEWENDLGLGWLFYGFRCADPAIGRFTGIDPISDQFAWVSPFNYAENRPVDGIDLWGLQYINVNDFAKELGIKASIARMKFADRLITYEGQQYIKLSSHVADSKGNRLTKWLFMNIQPVVSASENVKFSEAGGCFEACEATLNKKGLGIENYYHEGTRQTFVGSDVTAGKDGVLDVNSSSKSEALDIIHRTLEAGNPVVVGLDYQPGHKGNSDKTTEHYVVIVGRGKDKNGTEYFRFYDNTGQLYTDESNKFILNEDGVLEYNSGNWRNDYKVTQVRETKKNK